MKIENKYPVMIFSKEYNGNIYYNMGLSKKDQNNKYINGYINVRFKKGVQVDDKKKIYIKDAWLDFYLKDKVTVPYVFINEFEYVEDAIEKTKEIQANTIDVGNIKASSIKTKPAEIDITDEEWPF